MGTMEDQIRKIVREEIARALSAAGEVANGALSNDPYQDTDVEDTALCAVNKVMERVARDVLANRHPEIPGHAVREGVPGVHGEDRACTACPHTAYAHRAGACFACPCPGWDASTPSTEPVHTITAVPERPKAACTCHRHTHVMGYENRCGSAFCYCLTPVRAQPEHAASTEPLDYNRACTVCSHGEHDQGKCGMHVYVDGIARPCPCLASRTLGAQPSTPPCAVCKHGKHVGMYCPECRCKGGSR